MALTKFHGSKGWKKIGGILEAVKYLKVPWSQRGKKSNERDRGRFSPIIILYIIRGVIYLIHHKVCSPSEKLDSQEFSLEFLPWN